MRAEVLMCHVLVESHSLFLTTMHQCFQVQEILQLVCFYLASPPGFLGPQPSSDLCSVALACKALKEPALRYLWYHVPDIAPLIMCMSKDLWKIDKKNRTLVRGKAC
jgi:hypothetical protein